MHVRGVCALESSSSVGHRSHTHRLCPLWHNIMHVYFVLMHTTGLVCVGKGSLEYKFSELHNARRTRDVCSILVQSSWNDFFLLQKCLKCHAHLHNCLTDCFSISMTLMLAPGQSREPDPSFRNAGCTPSPLCRKRVWGLWPLDRGTYRNVCRVNQIAAVT